VYLLALKEKYIEGFELYLVQRETSQKVEKGFIGFVNLT